MRVTHAGIVEAHPSFMNPYILPAAEAMLVIGSHEEFDADTRSVAIEFLLVYADAASSSGELACIGFLCILLVYAYASSCICCS